MMAVSRLLKSWATPPASRPIASIFCACRSCSSRSCSSRAGLPVAQRVADRALEVRADHVLLDVVRRAFAQRRLVERAAAVAGHQDERLVCAAAFALRESGRRRCRREAADRSR